MEAELFTDEASGDENLSLDCNSENYLNFKGERCGICMEVVIDQGVLDCCQHWFCFTCIDNWSTITNLCPLCQNEFQLITCVPVFDTVGGNQTDDESNLSDDDWFIEGKNSALSFPSYYIDENTVLCLGEGSCKIRNGSVPIEGNDIDTSIACDSCDKWYHAFCVGFDPETSCENSWLCPGCLAEKHPQRAGKSSTHGTDHTFEASTSAGLSVSDAEEGETGVSGSLVDGQQKNQESDEPLLVCRKDGESTLPHDSVSDTLISEALQIDRENSESNVHQTRMELSPSLDKCEPLTLSPDRKMMDPQLGLLDSVKKLEDGADADTMPVSAEPNDSSIIPSPALNMVPDENEVIAMEPLVPHETELVRPFGSKRKLIGSSETDDEEDDVTNKKFKADSNSQPMNPLEELSEAVSEDSDPVTSQGGDDSFDIMDIIKEPDKRSHENSSINERENNTGVRLKKIMRVAGAEKGSSIQEIRDKIREAVRDKSSEELGKNLFDPKLLDAFRAALAGPSEGKPTVNLKAKRSFLQKGKVRESLTKKIYGTGGKRRRAWTRDCEIEFWKHRCGHTMKPERVETLKAVLDVLRGSDDSNSTVPEPEKQEEKPSPLLGRLYLADTSVFPRKDAAVPFSALEVDEKTGKLSASTLNKCLDTNSQRHVSANSSSVKGIKTGAPGDAQKKGDPKSSLSSAALGKKGSTDKEKPVESDIKGDKRKWALEVLARKTVALGSSTREKEDSAGFKEKYPLMARLPEDMRPILASCRHNKIPGSVRQAQLYRITEHFLKKLNLSVLRRCAETELAVADAVNIEKLVADKSNSKLVYVNLCSQELLRRSDDLNSNRAEEANPCSTSGCLMETIETDSCSLGSEVDEALKNAGLMSDSPPSSPKSVHVETRMASEVGLLGGSDNVAEAATCENVSHQQSESPKIEVLISSMEPEKQNEVPDLRDPDLPVAERLNLREIQDADSKEAAHIVTSSSVVGNDQKLSHAERHGPDTERQNDTYPGTTSIPPSENAEKNESLESKADRKNNNLETDTKAKKTAAATNDTAQSKDSTSSVVKKVESYIKEHLRPLCKSGVISVEQYRWAVGKTTEKVMKYHEKEKNASFLIREGDKVKKLAWQYVEASQHKSKNQET